MCSRSFLSLITGAALVVGSAAQAAPLTTATWQTTLRGISLSITNAGATCTDTTPSVHTQGNISSCSPGGLQPTGSATATSYSVSLTVPLFEFKQFTTGGVAINLYTHAKLSGSATVTGTNSGAFATFGVQGTVTVKQTAHAGKGVNASMLTPRPTTLVKVPLSVGQVGTFTDYFYPALFTHYIRIDYYAWTPHTLTFTGLTSKYAPLPTPTVVAMGSFNLNSMGSGTVVLVAPSKISIDGPLFQRRTVSVTSLTLTYVPEPGTLLLLGASVAGLVLIGSRKHS